MPISRSELKRLNNNSAGNKLTTQEGTPRIASGIATRSVRKQQLCRGVSCTAWAPPTSGTRTSTGLLPCNSTKATPSPASFLTCGRNAMLFSLNGHTGCIFPGPPGCMRRTLRPVEFTNHHREYTTSSLPDLIAFSCTYMPRCSSSITSSGECAKSTACIGNDHDVITPPQSRSEKDTQRSSATTSKAGNTLWEQMRNGATLSCSVSRPITARKKCQTISPRRASNTAMRQLVSLFALVRPGRPSHVQWK
mmetsp:Transcript_6707/g.19140  ORF Transcript_6707/g.19140 Transcript_6707/m.19140 type:complete len:250 (+) Transcript_6707:1693-2442(+)